MVETLLEKLKLRLQITTTNQDNLLTDCMDEALSELNTQLRLLANLADGVSFDNLPDHLITYFLKYSVARYYFYSLPDHPTEPTAQAKTSLKDYLRATYQKQSEDGISHKTFKKTDSNVRENHGL